MNVAIPAYAVWGNQSAQSKTNKAVVRTRLFDRLVSFKRSLQDTPGYRITATFPKRKAAVLFNQLSFARKVASTDILNYFDNRSTNASA